jgi:hypothetical protein
MRTEANGVGIRNRNGRLRPERWSDWHAAQAAGQDAPTGNLSNDVTYPLGPEGSVLATDVKGHGTGRRADNPKDVSG